ncbi:hypothetical protein Glove_138g26 [Diversispora epigaea]|uniref:ZZ-type domain-containing protein n=1 Tax=Diversispora epigaea TaxID=1348612 RepID=A0A397J573_9GLOM|nr:hypothetical protein Glove_138g26 [Diversispora epigaea]
MEKIKNKRKSNSYNTNNNNNNNNNIDNNNNNTDLLNNALNEIKQLKTKFYESDIEREGLKTLTESLKLKIRQLQKKVIENENSKKENIAFKSQKELLEEEIEKLQHKSREYEKIIQQLRNELQSLTQQNSQISQNKIELENKNHLLGSEIQRLKTQLVESDKEINDLKSEAKRLSDRINTSERNRINIKNLQENLDLECKRLQRENAEKEIEIENLQSEIKRLKDKCVTMYQESDEAAKSQETLKGEIKKLQLVIVEQDRIMREKYQPDNIIHPAYCNVCSKYIAGIRYKCGHCDNYDICDKCESSNHYSTHVFIKIKRPIDNDRFIRTALLPEFKLIEKDENDIDHQIICSVCNKNIKGIRHKCGHCVGFELCVNCEAYPFNLHDPSHVFLKIKRPVHIDSNEPILPPDFRPLIKSKR